jgi:beta-carotene 3-hydroxylase
MATWGQALAYALTLCAVAVSMELWAAFLHRAVWHRALWWVHRTHHRGRGDIDATRGPAMQGDNSRDTGAARAPIKHKVKGFELNDAMPVLHAPVAIGLIVYGCEAAPGWVPFLAHAVGMGMTVFGGAYLFFHDGVAHGRFLPQGLLRALYRLRSMRLLRSAHVLHHRHGSVPYGLFFGPHVVRRLRLQRRKIAGLQGAAEPLLPPQRLGQYHAPAQQRRRA